MIHNLREKLQAIARQEKPVEVPCHFRQRVLRYPLPDGLLAVRGEQTRWLGLDQPTFAPAQTLFLDTETTGLRGAGTVAFLVGLGWVERDAFVVTQLWMPDYGAEHTMLCALQEIIDTKQTLVTFNGASFDVPLLNNRFLMNRMRSSLVTMPHLDLLTASRRAWKLRLKRCNLTTLETEVLGIERPDDLPGSEIPARYFAYLKSGDETLLTDIFTHNAEDIVSLARLLSHASQVYDKADVQKDARDVFSLGVALARAGEGKRARRCFRVASVSLLSQRARVALAESYRTEKRYMEAADAYRALIARGEADLSARVALCILLEHRLRDLPAALCETERAIVHFAGSQPFQEISKEDWTALYHRRNRLKRLVEKRGL